jgi:hypothetical protein
MQTCEPCAERWEAERHLNAHLRAMRVVAAGRRSPEATKEALLAQFAARNRRAAAPRWQWAMALAAALLLSIIAVPWLAHQAQPASPTAVAEEVADAPQDEGFIPVPYVPPLATGEMVRIVHTELNPAALTRLGVSVDPAWTAQLPADLLMGEDGLPRAVRVSDVYSGDGAF